MQIKFTWQRVFIASGPLGAALQGVLPQAWWFLYVPFFLLAIGAFIFQDELDGWSMTLSPARNLSSPIKWVSRLAAVGCIFAVWWLGSQGGLNPLGWCLYAGTWAGLLGFVWLLSPSINFLRAPVPRADSTPREVAIVHFMPNGTLLPGSRNIGAIADNGPNEYTIMFASPLDPDALVVQPIGATPQPTIISHTANAVRLRFATEAGRYGLRFDSLGQAGSSGRRLSAMAKNVLTSALKGRRFAQLSHELIWIRYASAYVECKAYAFDIASAFSSAGWRGKAGTTFDEEPDLTGVKVYVASLDEKPLLAQVVAQALTEAAIPFEWWRYETVEPERVIVFIYPEKLF